MPPTEIVGVLTAAELVEVLDAVAVLASDDATALVAEGEVDVAVVGAAAAQLVLAGAFAPGQGLS